MESPWLKERRQHFLEVALRAPELSDPQRATLLKMDGRWAMLGFTLQSRVNKASQARALAHFIRKPFAEATKQDVENYVMDLARRTTPSSFLTIKRFLKVFYRELLTPGQKPFPAIVSWISLRTPVGVGRLPEDILTKAEVDQIARACTHPRDRAIVMVSYDSACRPGELVSARVGGVEFDAYGARITLAGKTGDRKVRLLQSVADVKTWLDLHPRPGDPQAPLFTSLSKGYNCEPLFQDGISRAIAAAAKRAGVKKHVTPYTMRRSRLTHLSKILTEVELKVFAGWGLDSKMVKVYVHLSGQDVDAKLLRAAGVLPLEHDRSEVSEAPKRCPGCGNQNSAASRFCSTCKMALDEKDLLRMAEVHERIVRNLPLLERLTDPRVRQLLGEIASENQKPVNGEA